jgi:hypothetical protein
MTWSKVKHFRNEIWKVPLHNPISYAQLPYSSLNLFRVFCAFEEYDLWLMLTKANNTKKKITIIFSLEVDIIFRR